jgi:hypothetical protein
MVSCHDTSVITDMKMRLLGDALINLFNLKHLISHQLSSL